MAVDSNRDTQHSVQVMRARYTLQCCEPGLGCLGWLHVAHVFQGWGGGEVRRGGEGAGGGEGACRRAEGMRERREVKAGGLWPCCMKVRACKDRLACDAPPTFMRVHSHQLTNELSVSHCSRQGRRRRGRQR
jgi:hypothetical protein